MPVRYFIDEDRGLLVAQASGVFTHEEQIEKLTAIVEETQGAAFFMPHLYLVDRFISLHALTFDDIVKIKESMIALGRRYPGRNVRTAFVVTDEMHARFARLWQALSETQGEVGSTIRLFNTEESAVAWLKG